MLLVQCGIIHEYVLDRLNDSPEHGLPAMFVHTQQLLKPKKRQWATLEGDLDKHPTTYLDVTEWELDRQPRQQTTQEQTQRSG